MGLQGPAGIVLIAHESPNYQTVSSSPALAFSTSFSLSASGPVKISWDDARQGVFGALNSFCDYRLSVDGVSLGHRRLTVNGALNAVTDWGTYTFFAPVLGSGIHGVDVFVLPGQGATCFSGSGALGLSSLIIEAY
jgi:hypothetical protein